MARVVVTIAFDSNTPVNDSTRTINAFKNVWARYMGGVGSVRITTTHPEEG